DIRDRTFAVIMQSLPQPRPFIISKPGTCKLILEICLPPLIPGTYAVDFWLGHDYTQTVDHILHPLSSTSLHSPHAGLPYPHSIEQGSVATISHVTRCVYEKS